MIRFTSRLPRHLSTALALSLAFAPHVFAESYTIDEDASVFAVITHKEGILNRLGHNHVVYARNYQVSLEAEAGDGESVAFDITVPVNDLNVPRGDGRDGWYEQLEATGILSAPLREMSVTNHEKVRKNMLSEKQLDVERFPEIIARITRVRRGAIKMGRESFDHIATVEVTIRDRVVTRDFAAAIAFDGDTLSVEATGPLNFTDFGIKPYSVALGTIRNQDTFDLYVNLTASK